MKRTVIATLGLLAMGTFCARDGSAYNEARWYPGVSCKYYGKQGSDSYFDPSGYAANGIKNTDASSRYAVCPMFAETMAPDTVSIIMSTNSDVCKVYAKDHIDMSQTVYSRSSVTATPTGHYTHTFTLGYTGYRPKETYTLYCNVPAGGVIREYEMLENNP